jgi:hypothetical protein
MGMRIHGSHTSPRDKATRNDLTFSCINNVFFFLVVLLYHIILENLFYFPSLLLSIINCPLLLLFSFPFFYPL